MLINTTEALLYEMALQTVNKTFKYDCGSGEKTYNAKNFNPKNENQMIEKDLVDCLYPGENYSEKNALNKEINFYLIKYNVVGVI